MKVAYVLPILLVALADVAFASNHEPMARCEAWRAEQAQKARDEGREEGTIATQKCEVAGAVFFVHSGFGQGEGGAQGPAFANITVNRCEPSLARDGICHAVWRDSMGRQRTMTIPVGGDRGSVFEQGVGPAGQGSPLGDIARQMEQDRLQQAMAQWNDRRDASQFTPEALQQITRAFGEEEAALGAQESALRAEADRHLQNLPEHLRNASLEELQRMGNSLVPYAGDAGAAARNLQLMQGLEMQRAELVSSAEEAFRSQGPLRVPIVDHGSVSATGPASFPVNTVTTIQTEPGVVASTLGNHEQRMWEWIERFEASPPTAMGAPISNPLIVTALPRLYTVIVGGWAYMFGELGY